MLDKLRAQVEADDIIQEIYLEVFRNFHKFEYRDPNSFYKWLVTVIGWKIRDFDKYFFKTSKRQPGETLSLSDRIGEEANGSMRDLAETIRGRSFTPSQIAVQREGYRMLEAALEKLPPHYREVIRLRHLEQRSARETAELLALKVNAVNVLFHRAQQRLHEVLREMSYFSE
jgi:RNA polymerase sigma-70 factor (ECF subfamily)